MSTSLERLQIDALAALYARQDLLKSNIAATDALSVAGFYLDYRTATYVDVHLEPEFMCTEQDVSNAIRATIKSNLQVALDKVEDEIKAVGSPIAKVETTPLEVPAEPEKKAA